jgi:hypothetical protein
MGNILAKSVCFDCDVCLRLDQCGMPLLFCQAAVKEASLGYYHLMRDSRSSVRCDQSVEDVVVRDPVG